MKKRLVAFLITLVFVIGLVSASAQPRWAYFSLVNSNIYMEDNKVRWYGDADTYMVSGVTNTEIIVKLQVKTSVGWGTLETATDSDKNFTSAGGRYSDWSAGKSYRVKVEAWAYNGDNELEYVGPYYGYLNT